MKKILLIVSLFIGLFGLIPQHALAQAVTGVSLNKHTLNLDLWASEQLVATISPSDAANTNVVWHSSNDAIIHVDNTGNVTAYHDGVAAVYVKTDDGNLTDSCIVTCQVSDAANIVSFSFSGEAHSASISDDNMKITGFMPYGTDATNITVGNYQLSPGATIDPLPENVHNFSDTVSFVVTASDGTTQKTWKVYAMIFPDLSGAQKVELNFSTAPQGWISDTVSWEESDIHFHVGYPNPADTSWPPSASVGVDQDYSQKIGIALFPANLQFYLKDTNKVIVAASMYILENCDDSCSFVYFQGANTGKTWYIDKMTREFHFYDLHQIKADYGKFRSFEGSFSGITFWIANKDGSVNHTPVADAGPDQTVHSKDTVQLDGSASLDPDQQPLHYQWSAPGGIVLDDPTLARPSFIAPNSMDTLHLTFTLSVSDGSLSATDQVIITVIPTNHLPVANAGPDQTVMEGDSVHLDGTASSDPDGDPITYQWLAPGGITLTDASSPTPAFLAPEVQQTTVFSFALIVNDGLVNSVHDTVFITVNNRNHQPIAWFDIDSTSVYEGDTAYMDGHYSYDPDGDSLSFHWWADQGSGIRFFDSTAMDVRCGTPMVNKDTTFKVYLKVDDGSLYSDPDTFYLRVQNINAVPVAVLQKHTTPVFDGDTVYLDGSGSSDADGDSLIYKWTAANGIWISGSGSTAWFIAPIVQKDTPYFVTLVVNDGTSDSPPDTDTIWVQHKNHAPVAESGYPIEIFEGDSSYLYGSLSYDLDGDSLRYSWKVPAGFWIADSTQPDSRFSAPQIVHDTTFSLVLTVFDGQLYSQPDTCRVTVKKRNQAPVAKIVSTSPIFYGVSMNEGDTLWIDGSPSYDPDGDPITYDWALPKDFQFYHYDSVKVMVIAPSVTQTTSYSAALYVKDPGQLRSSDRFTIQVLNVNNAPVAESGYPIEINEGDSAYLYGSLSYDLDGDSLSYSWDVPAGFWIADSTQADSRFSAPHVMHDTTFSLVLTVFDGQLYSQPDTCRVTVKNVNQAPIADIVSTGQTFFGVSLNEGDSLWIDGSPSYDPDGDSITYDWAISKDFDFYHYDSVKVLIVAHDVAQTTSFDASLFVSDGLLRSEKRFIIQVLNVNQPPYADAGKDFRVLSGQTGQLDASVSYDPDMDSLRFTWTAPNGIILDDPHAMKPHFVAPQVTQIDTLHFSLVVSDGLLNSATVTVEVQVIPLVASLSVSPYLHDTLLPDAMRHVSIYYHDGSSWIPENILSYEESGVSYFAVWQGEWMISVDPLSDNAGFVSTFSGDVPYWAQENSFSVTAGAVVNQNIHLIAVSDTLSGDGRIDGTIYRDPDSTATKRSSINRLDEKQSDLPPAEGVSVFLYQKSDDALLASRLTDENGKFVFDKLPHAIYYLSVQLPGYDENEHWDVVVSDTTTQTDSVNFVVNEAQGSVTDVPNIDPMDFNLYPNPTRGQLQIRLNNFEEKESTLYIYDITGHLMLSKKLKSAVVKVDISQFRKGIYFVRIMNQNKVMTRRIVKH